MHDFDIGESHPSFETDQSETTASPSAPKPTLPAEETVNAVDAYIDKKNFLLDPTRTNLWELYQKHKKCFWTEDEVNIYQDSHDWKELDNQEQQFIKTVLAFFSQSDAIVVDNLLERFLKDSEGYTEAQYFYMYQAMAENVHTETYTKLIRGIIQDVHEREEMLDAIHTMPVVREKAEWAIKWIVNQSSSFATRLVAFTIVEGIFFSGSFAAIFWLKQYFPGKMPGLVFSNELISRDEGIHTKFGYEFYKYISKDEGRLPPLTVQRMVNEAVELEKRFFQEAIPHNLKGMNSELMGKYIEMVADFLLENLGYDKLYLTDNPFTWMNNISIEGKSNFFERRVGEYQKVSLSATAVNQSIWDDQDNDNF